MRLRFAALCCCLFAITGLRGELQDAFTSVHRRNASQAAVLQATPSKDRSQCTIILDAGHGGSDQGTQMRSFHEKKLTLTTALYTKKHLEEMGYKVLLTRSRDIFVPLPLRVQIANENKATLFVSIHYNSSRNTQAKGIEVFYYAGKEGDRRRSSNRLADCILHHLVDETEATSRGVKKGNFLVIRETEMPAVLVEGGFLTNFDEFEQLRNRQYLDQVAKGIALGIEKYIQS